MHRPGDETVMVAGGSGFLGSHLCDHLIAAGRDVLCVDNHYTGTKQNIRHLLDSNRFEFMRHDVTFPLFVEVGQIYNLACPASPIHYQRDPVLRRSRSASATGILLGQRESDRDPLVL